MMHADDVRFDRRGRKGRSVAEKLSIVQLTMEPWNSCDRIVRTHGVNANQSFKWRRLFDRGAAERSESEIDGLAASHDYYRSQQHARPCTRAGRRQDQDRPSRTYVRDDRPAFLSNSLAVWLAYRRIAGEKITKDHSVPRQEGIFKHLPFFDSRARNSFSSMEN